jgi:hypothetical protein
MLPRHMPLTTATCLFNASTYSAKGDLLHSTQAFAKSRIAKQLRLPSQTARATRSRGQRHKRSRSPLCSSHPAQTAAPHFLRIHQMLIDAVFSGDIHAPLAQRWELSRASCNGQSGQSSEGETEQLVGGRWE